MLPLYRRLNVLFDDAARRRFYLAMVGSVFIAFSEGAALLAVVPLMALVGGDGDDAGLRWLRDRTGQPSDTELAFVLAGLILGAFVVKGLSALAIRWWTLGFVNDQAVRTSATLMNGYLRAPMSVHSRRGSADLLRTMNDAVNGVFSQVIGGGIMVATEAITIAAMSTVLLIVAPLPALAVGVYFVLAAYLLQRFIKHRVRTAGAATIDAVHETARVALQSLGGIKEIKLRNEHDLFADQYATARAKGATAIRTSTFLSELPKYALELVFILGIGLMTALIYRDGATPTALGKLALFAAAGFRIMPSSVRLLASLTTLRAGLPSLDLVERDLLTARVARRQEAPDAGPVSLARAVVLDDVSFRYPDGDALVLDTIRLTIPAGSSIALVGGSGAGKSTLVDLILGLQTPTSGCVLADGVDVADRLPSWQRHLAMVPQDVFLLEGTIRENVVFSPGERADDARVWRSLELANLAEHVRGQAEGLDLATGERGTKLSGGQRQRVGIARALYREPSLLVLDEATSALDNETEHEITRTIDGLKGQITTVVVAHRLSTVRHCDTIAFMKEGRIIALGGFDELRQVSPEFERLVQLGSLDAPPSLSEPGSANG